MMLGCGLLCKGVLATSLLAHQVAAVSAALDSCRDQTSAGDCTALEQALEDTKLRRRKILEARGENEGGGSSNTAVVVVVVVAVLLCIVMAVGAVRWYWVRGDDKGEQSLDGAVTTRRSKRQNRRADRNPKLPSTRGKGGSTVQNPTYHSSPSP